MKILSFVAMAGILAGSASAAPLKTANLTKKINDVRISESSRQARVANVGDKLTGSSTVLTGRQSRAELTFPDKTITRIGANAAFRFNSGSRDMEIQQGSFLLQVPKNAGGATIRTSTVTAAITGTTTMMEFCPGLWVKFICLEGTAKLSNRNGDKVEVPPGMMIAMHPDAAKFPPPFFVNVKKTMNTSALTDKETFGPLGNGAEEAINGTMENQLLAKREGTLLPGYLLDRGVKPVDRDEPVRTLLNEITYRPKVEHNPGGPFDPENPFPPTPRDSPPNGR